MTEIHLEIWMILAVTSVTYSQALRRVERLRRAVTEGRTPNLLNAFTFCAIVMLPPAPTLALIVVMYIAEWPARRVVAGGRPFRYIYSAAVVMLSALAAQYVIAEATPWVGLAAGIATFEVVNIGGIAAAMAIAGHWLTMRRIFLSAANHRAEIGTQILGAGLGVAATWNLFAILAVAPVLLVMHRAVLTEAIRDTRSFNTRTGLWSETAWTVQAEDRIRAGRHYCLILISPHHCDRSRVAEVVRNCVSSHRGAAPSREDMLGCYGGGHIIACRPAANPEGGLEIARRVRLALDRAGYDCAVGSVTSPSGDIAAMKLDALSELMGQLDRADWPGR